MGLSARDQVVITDDDRHAVVGICAILFLVLSVVSVAGRLFTKFSVGTFNRDDWVMGGALAASVAQTIAVLIASENGLAKRWDLLSDDERVRFDKAFYTSGIFFIIAIVLSKISTALFIRGLSPLQSGIRMASFINIAFAVWGITYIIASIFRCAPPNVWQIEGGKCFDIPSFWISFAVLNIVTDLFLFIWPTSIIVGLQTNWRRKSVIIVCFGAKIIMIAQIYYLASTRDDPDLSWRDFPVSMTNQLVVALSISTACVPCMRPFFESLETGMLRSDDLRRRGPKTSVLSSALRKAGSGQKGSKGSRISTKRMTSDTMLSNIRTKTDVRATPSDKDDGESMTSRSKFITMETSIDVRSESVSHDDHIV